MTETAVLRPDNVIVVTKATEYDDGNLDDSEFQVKPDFTFYKQCKRRFALEKPGDWQRIVYAWKQGRWIDAESNEHWIFD